jgi:hypothetical protein
MISNYVIVPHLWAMVCLLAFRHNMPDPRVMQHKGCIIPSEWGLSRIKVSEECGRLGLFFRFSCKTTVAAWNRRAM